MNVLVGVVLAGESKNYCVKKFLEMEKHVFTDVDVMYAVDYPRLQASDTPIPYDEQLQVPQMAGSMWATEIVFYGKAALREVALNTKNPDGTYKYDALVWQGIDCFYKSKEDFDKLIATGDCSESGIVGALVAGRNKPEYPVCRYFIARTVGDHITYLKAQGEVSRDYLNQDKPVPVAGYIGSDATLVKREVLDAARLEGYQHWHTMQGKDQPLGALGPEEFIMWEAVARLGVIPIVVPTIRPYHVHENLMAARYPDTYIHMDEINWD